MPSLPELVEAGVFVPYALCQAGLIASSAHRWPMLGTSERAAAPRAPWWPRGHEPRVLVQLPVCDEPAVVDRLVAAAAALAWPRHRLEIQLLDDSNDAAAALGAAAASRAPPPGVEAPHRRPPPRARLPAGAPA